MYVPIAVLGDNKQSGNITIQERAYTVCTYGTYNFNNRVYVYTTCNHICMYSTLLYICTVYTYACHTEPFHVKL